MSGSNWVSCTMSDDFVFTDSSGNDVTFYMGDSFAYDSNSGDGDGNYVIRHNGVHHVLDISLLPFVIKGK